MSKHSKPPMLKKVIPISLMRRWYEDEEKSAPQIQEIIKDKYGITYTRQAVHSYIKKYIGTRKHAVSMKVRVYKKRIDLKKVSKKIDYKNRNTDYKAIYERQGYLWAVGLNDLLSWTGAVNELAWGIGCAQASIVSW